MDNVISSQNVPIKLWLGLDKIESGALDQAKNLANLPHAFKHIAILPDTHQGYGMPIGAIASLKGVVSPNMVGVDIGCGMCAVKTSLTDIDTDTIKKIMGEIRKAVPVGFNKHKEMQDEKYMPAVKEHEEDCFLDEFEIVYREFMNARKSLGTLGGGNHFIEIQKGSGGFIWIMIHSGSRNLGLKVAEHYNKLAVKLNEQWKSVVPKSHELAFLPMDSEVGKSYLREMQYCVDYALANRKLMMNRIQKVFVELGEVGFDEIINIAHNYASMENHFGQNVMVHRKGATQARKGQTGIIPGSQGTKSFIVEGLGNPETFMSCSHGAGRLMSRSQAKKVLNLEEEKKKLDDKGVIHGIRGIGDLDEASGAYKPIEEVMENQKDLVKVLVELEPLAVIKG